MSMEIKIDDISLNVAEGTTILDASRQAGLNIPTLCHIDGMEPYTSCMVCLVKDRQKNEFIPSCSALAREGMDIDASSDEVVSMRKKAVELLLSEHRAECEAPCHVVCPAGYHIPEMNRLLTGGRIKEAVQLAISDAGEGDLRCFDCTGYCENACRRKKIDLPVSIRNIQLFVYGNSGRQLKGKDPSVPVPSRKISGRFSSRIGRLEDAELMEWIKESNSEAERFREINDFNEAASESGSCMRCDCRAKDNCSLRELAQGLSLKDPAGKATGSPVRKKINNSTGLIFENAKCIKCGLCVRVAEKSGEVHHLCFINRGFVTIISEPLTSDFNAVLAGQADKCAEACPTGALAFLGEEK